MYNHTIIFSLVIVRNFHMSTILGSWSSHPYHNSYTITLHLCIGLFINTYTISKYSILFYLFLNLYCLIIYILVIIYPLIFLFYNNDMINENLFTGSCVGLIGGMIVCLTVFLSLIKGYVWGE